MTTNKYNLDPEDIEDIVQMFDTTFNHSLEVLNNHLYCSLCHNLHEEFGFSFADIDHMVDLYRNKNVEAMKEFIINGKSATSQK